jgi:hypothetical protein
VDILVFKGGNALELIYRIGQRSSLDMDFSMQGDVQEASEIADRLFAALHARFQAAGLVIFDERFEARPPNREPGDPWGGYGAEFKLIELETYNDLGGNLEAIRRQAIELGPEHQRKFKIEISPFEHTVGKVSVEVEGNTAYVYTVEMIAVEKLRAICQQSPDYPHRSHPAPRARDFYDIHSAISEGGVDLASPQTVELIRKVFAAKDVELSLLRQINDQREFHRPDWSSVQNAVRVRLRQFDFYFEFVLAEIERLESLWVE